MKNVGFGSKSLAFGSRFPLVQKTLCSLGSSAIALIDTGAAERRPVSVVVPKVFLSHILSTFQTAADLFFPARLLCFSKSSVCVELPGITNSL
jgi:hypothetical protein